MSQNSHRSSAWQLAVVAVGLLSAAYVGVAAAPHFGARDASLWAALLVLVFAMSYGANRLQLWLVRPPVAPWKGAITGVVVFSPMFLVWFPSSAWMADMGRIHGYANVPSPFWMAALMVWGLVAPGGVVAQGMRRLTGGAPTL